MTQRPETPAGRGAQAPDAVAGDRGYVPPDLPIRTGDHGLDRRLHAMHGGDEALRERVLDRHVVHRGKYLVMEVDSVELGDGAVRPRELVGHPGAVAIVALDDEDQVVFVRQYRLAAGRVLLEIPAGTLDRAPDGTVEEPAAAAPRELEEETGLQADAWRRLAAFWTAPGFATEHMTLYLASGLRPAHPTSRLQPDEDERLELVRLPWRDALRAADAGAFEDAKTLLGLLWLARLKAIGEA